MPKFAELFARLEERGELPFLTTGLLWTSDTLGRYGLLIVAAAGRWRVLVARRQLRTERGQDSATAGSSSCRWPAGLCLNLAVSRFCRVLGTLLQNGVPILRALEISSDSTGNRVLAAAIGRAASNISSGESLAKPLAACGLFPQSVVEMISVAEESNTLRKC